MYSREKSDLVVWAQKVNWKSIWVISFFCCFKGFKGLYVAHPYNTRTRGDKRCFVHALKNCQQYTQHYEREWFGDLLPAIYYVLAIRKYLEERFYNYNLGILQTLLITQIHLSVCKLPTASIDNDFFLVIVIGLSVNGP